MPILGLRMRPPYTETATQAESPPAEPSGERLPAIGRSREVRAHERDFVVDAVMLAVATLAQLLTAGAAGVPVGGAGWLIAYPPLVLLLLGFRGMYRPRAHPGFLDDVRTVVSAAAVAAMALTFVRVLVTDNAWAGSQAVREWLFAVAYMTAGRGGVQIAERMSRKRGLEGRPTLIVGAGRVGHVIAQRLVEKPAIGLVPIGFIDDNPYPVERGSGVPVLAPTAEIEKVVAEYGVQHAILSFSTAPHDVDLAISERLRKLGVAVSIVPRMFEGIPDRMVLDRIGGLPLLSIYPTNPRGWQFAVKYALDRVLAVIAIMIASPLLIFGTVSVLLTIGRPILFRQRRVGLDGREFEMLKLRTMNVNPDEQGEADAAWAARTIGGMGGASQAVESQTRSPEGDSARRERTNRLTSVLRNWGIDELPQLFNVLKGDMSMVGPRPERESYVRLFAHRVHRYPERHRVKCGITGWAQVHGLRGETSLVDRVEWDNYYIENWSLWLDAKILLMTLLAVVPARGEPQR
jgi:exopolysaccharide biosynthesis polyprenyl glycosylphosphotransferase